jgi:2-polyprenyl-6-methoxyphenol hydroxylase-like FAD-dependent oxidoreductase
MSIMVPGIDGTLNLRHPDACQAMVDAAAAAGATVVRGVRDVKLGGGSPMTVSYGVNGDSSSVQAPLVVGADGRNSTVRKQAGITLEREAALGYISGLLLDGLDGVPADHDVMVAEGDLFFIMFHQGGGRARAYIASGLSGQHQFSGRDAAAKFLAACSFDAYPWSDQVASATPAGPCATYPGDDTWTDAPFAEGVVLVGDAAGHNDPIIGEGLSIALRDARSVRDLVLEGARQPSEFAPYAEERVERMRRLRLIADVLAVVQVEDGAGNRDARRAYLGDRMAAMDPEVFPLLVGAFAGPENIPEELVDDAILDRIRRA